MANDTAQTDNWSTPMSEVNQSMETTRGSGTPLPAPAAARISVIALGMSLGLFLSVSYLLCVLFDLWFPQLAMNSVWAPLLPGFTWLSWPSFFLGLVESFAYGWYVALIFGPLYNVFAARFGNIVRS